MAEHTPSPQAVEAFRAAWHEADAEGDEGNRVSRGLAAALAHHDAELRAEVERLREDYQAACEARMTFHDELDEAQRQLADLRAGIEAAVVTLNREAYRQPTPWIDRLANRLCALLAEFDAAERGPVSGGEPDRG